MAEDASEASDLDLDFAHIVSDLQVLSQSCRRDIEKGNPWNVEQRRNEFNQILTRLKQIRPNKCHDISDINADPKVLYELAEEYPSHRTYSCLDRIEAETSKLLGRLGTETTNKQTKVKSLGNKVFIVHGHDEGIKQTVARFLEKLDLNVVILHEQPNKGKTIMEKLESHSSDIDIGYAVVILTPDDVGKLGSGPDELYPRARQNVILELGYFVGKLGRERVCALKYGEIELPTDILGVIYISADSTNAWQLELAKELKAADFDIDLNKLAESKN